MPWVEHIIAIIINLMFYITATIPAECFNQSITGFIYGAINSLPVTAAIHRRQVAMVN